MRTKIEVAGGAVILVLLCLYGFEQYQKAVANRVATVIAQYDREAEAKLDAQQKQRDAQDVARQKDYDAKLSALQKLTPQQIVVKLPDYVPQAKEPIHVITPEEGSQLRTLPYNGALKFGAGDAIVPQSDIKPIAQALLDGNKCAADLASCGERSKALEEKYQLKSDEAAQWQKAAKGGSVWKRALKDAGKIAIGVGVGYALHR